MDNLNGRETIEFNEQRLAKFISDRPWLNSPRKLILIGHSYGGQISRFYAANNPDKVSAIFTLDTPHWGTSDAVLDVCNVFKRIPWLGVCSPAKDDAIQYFRYSVAKTLNENGASPGKMPHTKLYFVGSERNLLPGFDDAVPLDSQLGYQRDADKAVVVGSPSSGLLIPVSPLQADFIFTEAKRATFQYFFPHKDLHNNIIENSDLWDKLYTGICPLIKDEVGSGVSCSPAASQSLSLLNTQSSSAVNLNPVLPPAYPLRLLKAAAGIVTVALPQGAVNFVVESGKDLTLTIDSKNFNPNLLLSGPGGLSYTPTTVNGLDSLYQVSPTAGGSAQSFVIRNPAAGNWTLALAAPNGGSGPNLPAFGGAWEVQVSLRSPISLSLDLPEVAYLSGETVKVKAIVKNGTAGLSGLNVSASLLRLADNVPTGFTLHDDGGHDDGAAGDGLYSGSTTIVGAEAFDLTVAASGGSTLGAFQRQQNVTLTVGASESSIIGEIIESAPDTNTDGRYDSLNWTLNVNVPRAEEYTISGELAAKDGTIISGTNAKLTSLGAGIQPVVLTFDGRDIYSAAKNGPYTLQNLRIGVQTEDGELLTGRPSQTPTTGGPYWSWLSFEREYAPALSWSSPISEDVTRNSTFDLRWFVKDGNGGATVDLYYDEIGNGFAGTPIASSLAVVNGEMNYSWNVGALPDGAYFVYAIVRNGEFSRAVYGGSVRKLTDTDGDGMPDAWETAHGLNPNSLSDAYLDPDGDLLTNVDEYVNNTDPHNPDTDGGGEKDGSEVLNGRSPLSSTDDATGITILGGSPDAGDSRGGDSVMVLGSGFQNGATVSFGGAASPSVVFINSTKLLVTSPAHAVGTVGITVTNPASGGNTTRPEAFTFLYQFIETPIADNSGPICAGSTLQLAASSISGAAYSWTGPNGFASNLQNPSIASATAGASGIYSVTVTLPGFTFSPVATTVTVNPIPTTPVIAAPSAVAVGASGLAASVTSHSGSGYAWAITNGTITAGQGTNQITFTAGSGGTLNLQVVETSSSGCQSTAGSINVQVCAFSVTPGSQTFAAIGGSGSVMVGASAGCDWMAVSNDAWITITGGANGSGNGTVGYTVDVNVSGSLRIGTLSIASQTVTVTQAAVDYEADVAPRPNGSGTVVVSDWVQVGRFSVGLDVPLPGFEAQRADCAPRATLGDGHITVADWVQAGRYSVGLDPLTPVGGPTLISQAFPGNWRGVGTAREVQIASQSVTTDQGLVRLPVELVAQGGENGLTFSLRYDSSVMSYQGYELGRDAETGTTLLENTAQVGAGRIGFGIALRPGRGYPPGIRELIRVKFKVLNATAGMTDVKIGDGPALLGLVDLYAQGLSVRPVSRLVSIGKPGITTDAPALSSGTKEEVRQEMSEQTILQLSSYRQKARRPSR